MQVCCVTLSTQHRFPGNIVAEQHRLRQREVNERLNWGMPSWNGEEFDAFDTRATVYFVFRERPGGRVLGALRLLRTDAPGGYMLLNHFAHMVETEELPRSARAAEASRGVVDSDLPFEARRRVTDLFPLAYVEYGVAAGLDWIYGLATPAVWTVWTRSGWPVEHLGPLHLLDDGNEAYAGKLPVSAHWLGVIRGNVGVTEAILDYGAGCS